MASGVSTALSFIRTAGEVEFTLPSFISFEEISGEKKGELWPPAVSILGLKISDRLFFLISKLNLA